MLKAAQKCIKNWEIKIIENTPSLAHGELICRPEISSPKRNISLKQKFLFHPKIFCLMWKLKKLTSTENVNRKIKLGNKKL